MLSCCAARMSLDLAEMAIAIQIDQPAISGVKISWARMSGPRMSAGRDARLGKELGAGEEEGVDGIGDGNRRDQRGQRLARYQLVAADRRCEHGLECSLLALADDRRGGDRCRRERREGHQVQQEMPLTELRCV